MAFPRTGVAIALLGGLSTVSVAYAFQDLVVGERPAEEQVLFSADRVIRTNADSPVIAEGNVRAFFGPQTLLADRLTYDPATDIVTASGNVSVVDPDGQTFFADDVELTGDLKDGVARNFAALLGEQSRLVGSSVVRRSTGVNDLNNAGYTACAVCTDEGDKKTPTWQVKALRVTQDTNDEVIRFRNATIEVFGVPVAYTPYFEFPDPSVKRKSGFLSPSIGTSTRSGFEMELPYYWAISDHQDATFSPRYFSELGTLWKGEYRIARHDGGAVFQAGFIDPKNVLKSPSGVILPVADLGEARAEQFRMAGGDDVGLRWHLFGAGFKEFENDWRAEFDIDVVADKTYLRTYDLEPEDDLKEAVDVLQPDRLENELNFIQQKDDSHTEISAFLFQSLRTNEDNDYMADALPRIRHERYYDMPGIGGEATVGGELLVLHRPAGLDTMRTVADATYEKHHTTRGGHRLRGFAQLRADAYRYTDADRGIQSCNVENGSLATNDGFDACRQALPRDASEEDYTFARFLPTAGVEWSYPLAKFAEDATFIIEPRIQAVISPDKDFTDDVFNQDSQFFQFDTVTLFDWNKSTGYDQWEDGQRLNIGLSASAFYDSGLQVSAQVGQQFRMEDTTAFDADTGLGDTTSDIVGKIDVSYGRRFRLDNSFRIDDEDGTLRRMESNFSSRLGRLQTGVNYLRAETLELTEQGRRDEFLTASASYRIADRWLVGGQWRENLESGETTSQSILLSYRDDCTIFSLSYRFDNRRGDDFDINKSLTFNVDLIGF
jgi:LPS-assembly protein